MDDFEYSWDFGEVSELKKDKSLLEDKVIVLNKELELRHTWVTHHRMSVQYISAREYLATAKFTAAIEELMKYNPERAKQLKDLTDSNIIQR
jgi:hypothetical protein